jgi:hypothetical protein
MRFGAFLFTSRVAAVSGPDSLSPNIGTARPWHSGVVTVNEWWLTDPAERYWMETIRRDDFGDGIGAPFAKRNGVSTPYWELVNHVLTRLGRSVTGHTLCQPKPARRRELLMLQLQRPEHR